VAGVGDGIVILRQPGLPDPRPRLMLWRSVPGFDLVAQGTRGLSATLLRASDVTGSWLPVEDVTFRNTIQRLRAVEGTASAQFYRLLTK